MGNIVKKAIENPEKEKNIRDAFREFDRNKNGRLEKSEWVSFAKELRKTLRFGEDVAGEAAYIERVFHLADSDGDGVVSYDEFRDFIRSHSYAIGEDDGAKDMREKGKEEEEDSPKHLPSPSSSSSSSSLSPPPELRSYVDEQLEGGATSLSTATFPFLKKEYVVFRGVHERPRTFAHDRGDIDHNTYLIGVWAVTEHRLVPSEEYPICFSRYDLTMAEAIAFWRSLVVKGSYEEKPRSESYARCQGPSYSKNILRLSTYEYTGMRGSVYTHWRVEFPSSENGTFSIGSGRLDEDVERDLDRLAEEAREKARIEAERKKEDEAKKAAAGSWKDVTQGHTAYANLNRTFVAFIVWDGRNGWTKSHPNGSIPNCNLDKGMVSPRIISPGGNYSEDWENHPLQYCLDKLGVCVRLTPLNDWRLRNIAVGAVYDSAAREYRMSLQYKGEEVQVPYTFTASEGSPTDELTELFSESLEESVKMWADKEAGIVAVAGTKNPGGKTKSGSYKSMSGRPAFFFKVEKEDLNNSFNLDPCEIVTWKK